MADDDLARLRILVAGLTDDRYAPHPRAGALVLPDDTAAPEAIQVWAGVDANYPTYLSVRRGAQEIASPAGVVHARPTRELLHEVCVEDVREELDGDLQTLAYLEELVDRFAGELPGFAVRLQPSEVPDRLLWFGPDGDATLLWYEHDAFDRRASFARWVADLFEEDGAR